MSFRQIVTAFICLCVLLVGIVACDSREEPPGNLYFVQAGPSEEVSPRGPHSVFVYRLDEEKGSLTEVARTPIKDWVDDIKCFTNLDKLILSTSKTAYGGARDADRLYIFEEDSKERFDVVELGDYGPCSGFQLVATPTAGSIFKVQFEKDGARRETYIDSRTKEQVDTKSLSEAGEIRLAGPRPAFYGRSHDIVSLRMDQDGNLTSFLENYDLQAGHVPDSIIVMKESAGWTLIAAEPGYYVLISAPHKNGLTQRELLVYDRDSEQWNSVLIDGNETVTRLINRWLIGEVAQSDPKTDWMRRAGVPPILSGEIALVNPITLESYKVNVGNGAEFLWIDDNSDVYYRVGKELYHARLENGDFVDRKLILDAPFVYMIHWAFRSSVSD